MTQDNVGLVIVALGVLTSLLAARRLWLHVREHGDGGLAVVLAVAVGLAAAIETPLLPSGQRAAVAATVTAVCGVVILRRRARGSEAGGAGFVVLPAVLAVWLAVVDIALAQNTGTAIVLGRLVPAVVWVALAVVIQRYDTAPRMFALVGVLGFGLLSASTALYASWQPCSQFKCGPFNGLFAGPFPSENYLARLACLVLLLVFLTGDRRLQVVALLLAGLVLYASGSRTSELAVIIALLTWGLARAAGTQSVRRAMGFVVPVLATALGLYLVYSAQPADFSNRGYIWGLGRTHLGGDFFLGLGVDTWTSEVLARNFMHSQSLLLLYSGGLVAVLLYIAFVITTVRRADASMLSYTVGLVTLLGTLGLTEVVWNPSNFDGTTVFLVALMSTWGLSRSAVEVDEGQMAADEPSPATRERTTRAGFPATRV